MVVWTRRDTSGRTCRFSRRIVRPHICVAARRSETVARFQYEADGNVRPERFIAALTDFSERRPSLWPGLDAKFFKIHEVGASWAEVTEGTDLLGGVWAHE